MIVRFLWSRVSGVSSQSRDADVIDSSTHIGPKNSTAPLISVISPIHVS